MSREMVDSGIPWIGDVPKEWKKIRIKHIFEIIGGNGFKDKYQGKESGDYPFYKTSDINGDCNYVSTSSNYVDADVVDIENYNIVPVSSIVVSKIGAAMRKNHRKITTCDCCIDNNLQALHPIRTIDDVKYLYYLLKVVNFEWFDNNGTIPSVNNAKLKDLYVPWVSLSEQQRIAEFLDRKCAEVNEMIALQEQIIEELKAYKQSVITEAVTKGLNHDVPMRNSGIEWIGEIPEHWEVNKVSRNYYIQLGKMLQPNQQNSTDELCNYLCAANVGKNVLKLEPLKQMWISEKEREQYAVKKGDLLVVEGGDVASCDVVTEDVSQLYIQNALHRVRAKSNQDVRLLRYLLIVAKHTGHIDLICNKATISHFTKEKFEALHCVVIPQEEQKEILSHLDTKCTEIDNLISIKQSKIDSLKEYKKSIIYEYVTGKREVK